MLDPITIVVTFLTIVGGIFGIGHIVLTKHYEVTPVLKLKTYVGFTYSSQPILKVEIANKGKIPTTIEGVRVVLDGGLYELDPEEKFPKTVYPGKKIGADGRLQPIIEMSRKYPIKYVEVRDELGRTYRSDNKTLRKNIWMFDTERTMKKILKH